MYHTHNARAETLLSSPLFKDHVIQGHRCVIISDGYYEWQTTQTKNRQPYFLYKEPWVYNFIIYYQYIVYEHKAVSRYILGL